MLKELVGRTKHDYRAHLTSEHKRTAIEKLEHFDLAQLFA